MWAFCGQAHILACPQKNPHRPQLAHAGPIAVLPIWAPMMIYCVQPRKPTQAPSGSNPKGFVVGPISVGQPIVSSHFGPHVPRISQLYLGPHPQYNGPIRAPKGACLLGYYWYMNGNTTMYMTGNPSASWVEVKNKE